MRIALFISLALALAGTTVYAQAAIVYDMGGKFDKSFNEAAFRGAERWRKETGKTFIEFEISNEAQREQALRRMAERGANPVIAIGFSQGSSVERVSKDFPKQQFAIIDAVVKQPNVESVVFKEHEGSFLAATKVTPGLTVLGLKEGGVDYALDAHNASLVQAAMKARVDAAKADVIAGKIKVVDYMVDNACKY